MWPISAVCGTFCGPTPGLWKPWVNHPGNVHRQKLKLMEVGWGFTGSLDVEAYPKKTIAINWPQAKIVGHPKIYSCKHSHRHHGDVHSHHTLCGLFFTAGYRYTGPYDVPLLRVLNQSHLSSTPWKAQKHQRRFKNSKAPFRGSFFNSLKKKKNTKLLGKNNLFQWGRWKTWAQATIWTLWFQFTQGDRHSINPCKDLGSIQVVQLDGRNGWLGLDLKRKKLGRLRPLKS